MLQKITIIPANKLYRICQLQHDRASEKMAKLAALVGAEERACVRERDQA